VTIGTSRVATALLFVAALTVSACSEPTSGDTLKADNGVTFDLTAQQSGRVTTGKVDEIAALVPQAIRDRGTLRVSGSVDSVPPLGLLRHGQCHPHW